VRQTNRLSEVADAERLDASGESLVGGPLPDLLVRLHWRWWAEFWRMESDEAADRLKALDDATVRLLEVLVPRSGGDDDPDTDLLLVLGDDN
jgi:hypothetical protein